MNTTNLGNKFEQKYKKLWNSTHNLPDFVLKRSFDYQIFNRQDDLLFVGINPSYKAVVSNTEKTHPYFGAIENVSRNCGFDGQYSALDILAIRTPNLGEIKEAIKTIPGFKDFCIEQFKIFKEMLRLAKPRVIVVCNAYAREWMSNKNFNEEAFDFSDFDNEIGTKRIKNDADIENVPVFFSGMFSGKHIMDKGSRERLEWQIRRAKEKHLF